MNSKDLNKWVSEENKIQEQDFPTEDEMYEMIDGKYVVEEELSFGDYVDAIETYGSHSKDIATVMKQMGFDDRPLEELTQEVSDYRSSESGTYSGPHQFNRELEWDRVQALREIIAELHGVDTQEMTLM